MEYKSKLHQLNIDNKTVFVRADLNVPIKNKKIFDDFKLISIKPTLDYLISKNCKIILATHIGRPKNYIPELSTEILLPWFIENRYKINHLSEIEQEAIKRISKPGGIILLENLRFFKEEKDAI